MFAICLSAALFAPSCPARFRAGHIKFRAAAARYDLQAVWSCRAWRADAPLTSEAASAALLISRGLRAPGPTAATM
jgi:hypothetical protein